MRIAFISTMKAAPWGGSEELWSLVAKRAVNEGQEVLVSVADFSPLADKIRELESLGATIHKRPRFFLGGSMIKRVVTMLRRKIARKTGQNFNVIKKYSPGSICVGLSTTYDLLNEPELRQFLLSQTVPFGFISQGHNDVPFSSDEYRLIIRELFLKAKWIAFVSRSNLESCQRHLAVDLPHAFVVNNPANLKSLEYLPYPQPAEPLKFACVARIDVVQKGQDVLFETLGRPEWKSRNWELTIVGGGAPQEGYFKDMINYYGIENKVKFLGHISDIQSVWKNHHLLLLPSRYEGTPLALIEAMICGRTAVVTDAGGNAEWINNDNGFLAETANVKYFAKALERMWTDKHNLESLGKKCREVAQIQFNTKIDQLILKVIREQ